jgi:hypothetical protein
MRAKAVQVYKAARAEGKSREQSVIAAWRVIRQERKHLRAPNPFEAIHTNKGTFRSYRSPIAEVLQLEIPSEFGKYGARWQRTLQSIKEATEIKQQIIQWFDQRAEEFGA